MAMPLLSTTVAGRTQSGVSLPQARRREDRTTPRSARRSIREPEQSAELVMLIGQQVESETILCGNTMRCAWRVRRDGDERARMGLDLRQDGLRALLCRHDDANSTRLIRYTGAYAGYGRAA